jgi:hypothetical protein
MCWVCEHIWPGSGNDNAAIFSYSRKVSMGSGSRGYISSESTLEEPDSTEARIRRAEALQQELDSSE